VKARPRDAAPSSFEVGVLPDAESLALAAADEFARSAADAVRNRRLFRVALSGGSTPHALYRCLTRPPYRSAIAWERVRFFWGDERCVPPDSKRSNYRMARETLLDPLGIPPRQVFRMNGEEEPEAGAHAYEQTLRRHAAGRSVRLDLVLLGLGEDGHTASLFPGTAALDPGSKLVAANYVAKFSEWRITLTYRTLNEARRIVFVVSGAEKASAAARILQKSSGWRELPASGVCPRRGSLLWLLDQAAASKL
jgi:6-phosphogluconolactonase